MCPLADISAAGPATEFTDAICPTQWVVANGKVQLKGEVDKASRDADKLDWKQAETTLDALGNTVKVKVRSRQ